MSVILNLILMNSIEKQEVSGENNRKILGW